MKYILFVLFVIVLATAPFLVFLRGRRRLLVLWAAAALFAIYLFTTFIFSLYLHTIVTYSREQFAAASRQELLENRGYVSTTFANKREKPRYKKLELPGADRFCLVNVVRDFAGRISELYASNAIDGRDRPTIYEYLVCHELFGGETLLGRSHKERSSIVPLQGFYTTLLLVGTIFLLLCFSPHPEKRAFGGMGLLVLCSFFVVSTAIAYYFAHHSPSFSFIMNV